MSETNNNSSMKNLGYVLVIVGILALVASYFLVFSKYNTKIDTIDGEIDTLNVKYNELVNKNNNKDQVLKQTEEANSEFDEILAKFDGGVTYQSEIMDAYNMTQKLQVKVPNLSLAPVADAYVFGALPSSNPNGGSGSGLSEYTGKMMTYSINTVSTYDKMKEILSDISNTKGKRKTITAVSFTYNSTKQEVEMSINAVEYAITGGDRVQSKVEIPSYIQSSTNIFYNEIIKNQTPATTN